MTNKTLTRIKIFCSIYILLLLGLLVFFIVFGSVGTARYVNARKDQAKHDAKTECLLLSKSFTTDTCSTGG